MQFFYIIFAFYLYSKALQFWPWSFVRLRNKIRVYTRVFGDRLRAFNTYEQIIGLATNQNLYAAYWAKHTCPLPKRPWLSTCEMTSSLARSICRCSTASAPTGLAGHQAPPPVSRRILSDKPRKNNIEKRFVLYSNFHTKLGLGLDLKQTNNASG